MIDDAYATNARGWNDNLTPEYNRLAIWTKNSSKNAIKYVKNVGTDHQVGRNFNVFVARDIRWQNLVVSSIGVSSVINTGSPAIFFGSFFNVSLARMWAQATFPNVGGIEKKNWKTKLNKTRKMLRTNRREKKFIFSATKYFVRQSTIFPFFNFAFWFYLFLGCFHFFCSFFFCYKYAGDCVVYIFRNTGKINWKDFLFPNEGKI